MSGIPEYIFDVLSSFLSALIQMLFVRCYFSSLPVVNCCINSRFRQFFEKLLALTLTRLLLTDTSPLIIGDSSVLSAG